ncbi:MAG: metallophosphoesterase [Bacteroidales bacterium]|nr:metallophosphoesterase [Bacteroidales bacterium]
MRLPVIMVMICLLLQVAVDAYIFFAAWQRCRRLGAAKFQLLESAFFLIYIVVFLCLPKRGESDQMLQLAMWMLFFYLTVYVGKTIYVIFDLIASIPKLMGKKRVKGISVAGIVCGIAAFMVMWWGALINRHQIQVNEVTVRIDGLPPSFAGYRIAQISDLHVGTFGQDTTFISKLVEITNAQHPDLIVFTGDIVNRRSDELKPFVGPLSRLDAKDGVLSILGNHDYGDYIDWPSAQDKEINMEQLLDMQLAMNWELLTNSSTVIYGDTPMDSLVIIGVENWGEPPFPTYGELLTAYPTPGDSAVKILLTHNPVHWQKEVEPVDSLKIDLTLSGHTHAMQVAIGRLSPAALKYDTWGGLYESTDGRRPLYVNIGAGAVGVPMRIGATPEVTIFTLIPKKKR